jgi:hypothetical protein
VLIDGGSWMNIISKELQAKIKLLKFKPMLYNFIMVDHTIIKLVNTIKDLKILIYVIPFYVSLTIMFNSVIDPTYLIC